MEEGRLRGPEGGCEEAESQGARNRADTGPGSLVKIALLSPATAGRSLRGSRAGAGPAKGSRVSRRGRGAGDALGALATSWGTR